MSEESMRQDGQATMRSYDHKCYDLAKAFLSDEPSLNDDKHANELAQDIQDAIENYLGDECSDCGVRCHNHTCQQCEKVVSAHCICKSNDHMTWCSPNCREAFDL